MSAKRALRPHPARGLVLTAGGARGAYQAGVLQRIGERFARRRRASPFDIVTGASAGAINGAMVAASNDHFAAGTKRLAAVWRDLSAHHVYRTDLRAVLGNLLRAGADFGLGPLIGAGRLSALLDPSPLAAMLARELPLRNVRRAIERGDLHALAITASGYHSGKSYTFIEGEPGHAQWFKRRRLSLSTQITVDHILASAAIPLVFPPVALPTGSGMAWFGDGAMRLTHPCSAAIRLGSERVLAIGVRSPEAAQALTSRELRPGAGKILRRPPLAQIMGVFLNAIFLDHLDADLDHLVRINAIMKAHAESGGQADVSGLADPMRVVEPLVIAPSVDLAEIADNLSHRMPWGLRALLAGLGEPDPRSADLNSYLLFDPEYAAALIDIGYHDADDRIDEIEAFLRDDALPERTSRETATGTWSLSQ